MKENKEKARDKRYFREVFRVLAPFLAFAVIMIAVTLAALPEIRKLATVEGRERFREFVDGIGILGWFVTLGIQLLQIFAAFIPGEPVELMLGFVWGPWLGTFTCLFGIFIGTLVIYLLVRRFGLPLVKRAVGERDLTRYSFLTDERKIELTVFILFFIPGTPKDALTYIAPLTPIHPIKYILIATFARIPSVVTSTVLGDSIAEGDYLAVLIVFVITALISLSGIIFGGKFVKQKQEKKRGDD